ncbi:hypothetical protein [Halomarina oriensis]|uniref:Uncharacterized protein n=1 Tax=Halomarina oriensis TaxID=671145 RepID=A0A6B0GS90_9EURY|nr:hypothetical protein [Halomarina oriensis]MWG36177.1 hypothetical protein [Halomarina oriensis]
MTGQETATTAAETTLGRFTEWFRNRPTSLEFWEVVVTDRRLVCCFAGESFSAMLLRADMGERTRGRLEEWSPDEALVSEARNLAVPLSALDSLALTEGTRTRRARLELAWTDDDGHHEWTLSNTANGDQQRELVERLADHEAFSSVDVSTRTPRLAFL